MAALSEEKQKIVMAIQGMEGVQDFNEIVQELEEMPNLNDHDNHLYLSELAVALRSLKPATPAEAREVV